MQEEIVAQPKAPCMRCGHRKVDCHASCFLYLDYVAKNDKYKAHKAKVIHDEYIYRDWRHIKL